MKRTNSNELGQKKRKTRIVQFVLFLFLSAFVACDRGEEEIYILPKNYTGAVYVIFNQKTGAPPRYEAGKRVYEIPSNGILKTQFGFNEGWIGIPQYFYADGPNRTPVFYQLENRDIKKDTLQVCCIQAGTSYKDTKEAVDYELFFIGTKQQIDSAREVEDSVNISKYGE